jgi:hypothetical protein
LSPPRLSASSNMDGEVSQNPVFKELRECLLYEKAPIRPSALRSMLDERIGDLH